MVMTIFLFFSKRLLYIYVSENYSSNWCPFRDCLLSVFLYNLVDILSTLEVLFDWTVPYLEYTSLNVCFFRDVLVLCRGKYLMVAMELTRNLLESKKGLENVSLEGAMALREKGQVQTRTCCGDLVGLR